ncbi:MAG TPA: amino acid permease [Chitinophagaceae bacterium]|nr:amino acid permease [Chitinophagaceae bacterium]
MLSRSIRKWDLVLMMINSVIGAGIFGLPSKIFKLSGVYSIIAFFVCAVIIFIIILIFAEISSRFNKTGGPYLYAFTAFGRFPAFMMGWLSQLTRIVIFAALINLMVTYLSFFSSLFNNTVVRTCVITSVILLLTSINYIGVKSSVRVTNILTIAKLLPLLAFIIIGLFHININLFKSANTPNFSSFSNSVLLLTFAFGGFEGVLVNSGEIKNPRKTLPFALVISALIVTIFYCLIQVVCIGTIPALASSEKPLADAATMFIGHTGAVVISIGAVISIVATLNTNMLVSSRLPFAMSDEGQLPKIFSYTHPKYQTPVWSLLFYAGIAIIISITGSFIYAVSISVIARVLVYLIVSASLIKLRIKDPKATNYFKLPFGYAFAIVGVLFSLWLLSASKQNDIQVISVCVIAGIIFYVIFNAFKKKNRQILIPGENALLTSNTEIASL